jgi:hypothetical protein
MQAILDQPSLALRVILEGFAHIRRQDSRGKPYSLFKRLDNKTKDRLELIWKASMVHAADYLDFIEQKTGAKLPRDLRGSLKVCGDAFKVIRYHYEAPDKSRYYLTELPRILYAYILERRPEWDADHAASQAIASAVRANRPA